MNQQSITATQLDIMLKRQEETNGAYTGPDWRASMQRDQLKAAILDEMGEFLREIKPTWKWWDKNAVARPEQALFEFIDLFHFCMTLHLLQSKVNPIEIIEQVVDLAQRSYQTEREINLKSPLEIINNRVGSLLLNTGFIPTPMDNLVLLQMACCELLGYTPYEFYKAYILKNDRNRERVAKGVMRGVDVKAGEKDLTLDPA